jgi:hypothetical protein
MQVRGEHFLGKIHRGHHIWGPFWGPFLAPIFGSVTLTTHSGKGRLAAPNVASRKRQPARPGIAFLTQAQIGWQLWNYQCSDLPPGMTLLRMNLDETSVAFWHPLKKGTIVLENPYVARTATASTKATHAQQRTALTHIAVRCDRPDVQPFLPQVLADKRYNQTIVLCRCFGLF